MLDDDGVGSNVHEPQCSLLVSAGKSDYQAPWPTEPNENVIKEVTRQVLLRLQQPARPDPQAALSPVGAHALMFDVQDIAKQAKSLYDSRRGVDQVFGIPGFCTSPAWDIMLDLYIARSTNKAISTTSACIGAACPSTTALRWLAILEKKGLVIRCDDEKDRRRALYSLTKQGVTLTEKAINCSGYVQKITVV